MPRTSKNWEKQTMLKLFSHWSFWCVFSCLTHLFITISRETFLNGLLLKHWTISMSSRHASWYFFSYITLWSWSCLLSPLYSLKFEFNSYRYEYVSLSVQHHRRCLFLTFCSDLGTDFTRGAADKNSIWLDFSEARWGVRGEILLVIRARIFQNIFSHRISSSLTFSASRICLCGSLYTVYVLCISMCHMFSSAAAVLYLSLWQHWPGSCFVQNEIFPLHLTCSKHAALPTLFYFVNIMNS